MVQIMCVGEGEALHRMNWYVVADTRGSNVDKTRTNESRIPIPVVTM